jgi:hypothetical protein
MKATDKQVVGVDIAKNAVQVYTAEKETGEVISIQIRRAKFLQ